MSSSGGGKKAGTGHASSVGSALNVQCHQALMLLPARPTLAGAHCLLAGGVGGAQIQTQFLVVLSNQSQNFVPCQGILSLHSAGLLTTISSCHKLGCNITCLILNVITEN